MIVFWFKEWIGVRLSIIPCTILLRCVRNIFRYYTDMFFSGHLLACKHLEIGWLEMVNVCILMVVEPGV